MKKNTLAWIFWSLIASNVLLLVLSLLGNVIPGFEFASSIHEPDRLSNQLNPSYITIQAPATAPPNSAAPSSPPPSN